jgi:hypothetical protein
MTTQPQSPLTMLLSRHTRRREFITLLSGAAAVSYISGPLMARAQQQTLPVVGLVNVRSSDVSARHAAEFRKGLSKTGYVEAACARAPASSTGRRLPVTTTASLCSIAFATATMTKAFSCTPLTWSKWTATISDLIRLRAARLPLEMILAKAGPGIRFNEHMEGDGETVFRHACKLGLEGIVSKRKESRYRSGRSPDWLKMKNADAPAVKREAEEDWGKARPVLKRTL